MSKKPYPTAAERKFAPVPLRTRHDGWTPDKQQRFLEAIAASGCIDEACAAVGMSRQSAYRLRDRIDAQGFRMAWDAAVDLAMLRLTDACLSRAINGVPVPHFYQGEQVGEHRRYDNRLAMFLLRYRDPLRYAATLDQMVYTGHREQAAFAFAKARDRAVDEAEGVADEPPAEGVGDPPYRATPVEVEEKRQIEQAIVEGNGPIHGDHSRRWELTERRREYRARQGTPLPPRWPAKGIDDHGMVPGRKGPRPPAPG